MREDLIHYSVRKKLKANGWKLIAGQYPNGSDDELPPLYVVDPYLARDNSPDHRRHSKNKFVPDLVAVKDNIILIIEMKPKFYLKDELKLETLTTERVQDLKNSIVSFCNHQVNALEKEIEYYIFLPCLGFDNKSHFKINPKFCYFLVSDENNTQFQGNQLLTKLN